jgi:hypothetical protein
MPRGQGLEFIRGETIKWHSDKLHLLYGTSHDQVDAGLVNIVSQVVIDVRAQLRQA